MKVGRKGLMRSILLNVDDRILNNLVFLINLKAMSGYLYGDIDDFACRVIRAIDDGHKKVTIKNVGKMK